MTTDTLTQTSIFKAGAHANEAWLREAIDTVTILCRRGNTFTTDEIWQILDQLTVKTHERRALGAVMRDFEKSGRIRAVGARKSKRRECHGRYITEWQPVREPMEMAD